MTPLSQYYVSTTSYKITDFNCLSISIVTGLFKMTLNFDIFCQQNFKFQVHFLKDNLFQRKKEKKKDGWRNKNVQDEC
jgi:hypothetical protein